MSRFSKIADLVIDYAIVMMLGFVALVLLFATEVLPISAALLFDIYFALVAMLTTYTVARIIKHATDNTNSKPKN